MDIQWIHHAASGGQLIMSPQDDEMIMVNNAAEDDLIDQSTEYLVDDEEGADDAEEVDTDQIAAENLIFMAHDGQVVTEMIAAGDDGALVVAASDFTPIECPVVIQQDAETGMHHIVHENAAAGGNSNSGDYYAQEFSENTSEMVTEEVITDDWVQHQGEERVEIAAEQIIGNSSQLLLEMEVPLPTVQDEYTALRPYPCDFCSRRFRKKASLMNHMVAHQNDRPHLCKLCGSRFFRRSDLINHLRAHASRPDPDANFLQQRSNDHYYDHDWSIQNDTIAVHSPKSVNRKIQVVNAAAAVISGNSSSSSSSYNTGTSNVRGRISRLKPKEENYTIDEAASSLKHEHSQHEHSEHASMEYDAECQQLQAHTAAVKLDQDDVAEHQTHYPIIDDSKPFVCQQCGLAFSREKALKSHVKNHSNDATFECNQCNELFWDSNSLNEHQKTHHFEESNSEYEPGEESQSESEFERLTGDFYCSECGVYFHRHDLLRRHAKTHLKATQNKVEGDGVNDYRDQHCCNTCGETFAEALDLLAHAEIHARYPPFKCVLCGDSFFEESTIKSHLQRNHASEMTKNSCILCGKQCRDRRALMKHAWDHSREKCHLCSKCGKNFHNKARLKRHMASHRDKTVICEVCNEEFPDGRTLSNHRHSHSATSTGKLFPCHECGKTFGSRSSQQIHVRIHTGERPYGCRFCWKAFADGGTLRKHERIHTGEKPYACSVCPRAFNQRVVLREHIRSHHSGFDPKHGSYHCTVCSADLHSSDDLIQHLIQHSDMNTAMQRQPVTGPRKYKRRRKLKPHEIERLRSECKQNGNSNGTDMDLSDFDMDNVDDLLGITNPTTTTTTTSRTKSKKQKANASAAAEQNRQRAAAENQDEDEEEEEEVESDNNHSSSSNLIDTTGTDDKGKHDNDYEATKKKRYNSTSSNSDRLWQTKLINSTTSNEDSYKTLFTNLENTLQSIDTLVVGNNNNNNNNSSSNGAVVDVVGDGEKEQQRYNVADEANESIAQRTQYIRIARAEAASSSTTMPSSVSAAAAANKGRKRTQKYAKNTRPRMIHTEKTRISPAESNKRRSKPFITRIEASNLETLSKSNTVLVDDYEIVTPDMHPTQQISSSIGHIKTEQQKQQQYRVKEQNAYDNNQSIVHDLEEILRSPSKSGRTAQRRRFTSESSTQFLEEQHAAEQNFIKIEPVSPDLREIVTVSTADSSRRSTTRSTRSRVVSANRKYLDFETHIPATANSNTQTQKRSSASSSKSTARNTKKNSRKISLKTYLDYDMLTSSASATTTKNNRHHATSKTSKSNFSDTNNYAAQQVPQQQVPQQQVPQQQEQQQRKVRYFECEMCSAVFTDRAQLLDHVPIHI